MKTENILDQFQSHSVHYIVLASRSTEALRDFADTNKNAEAIKAIDACKKIGGAVNITGKQIDASFLMIDTRRFSQFTIDNFAMDTAIAGLSVPGSSSPNSVGLSMEFNIIDSTGISFANFLQYLMNKKLQVSFNGMSILVKLIFVGHTASGETKVIQSLSIPAIFSSIQVDLNDVKGVYACKCFPMIGMPSNARSNTSWTAIGTASNYYTGHESNTLGALVKSFEGRLNDESLTRYRAVNNITDQNSNTNRVGRQVQYMITIPKEWEAFAFSGPAQGGATEINFAELLKAEGDKKAANLKANSATEAQKKAQAGGAATAQSSHLAIDPNLTITEILDVIFSQVVEVQKLANFGPNGKNSDVIKFYKHLISVTSDDTNFTVHVDVMEFSVPNVAKGTATAAVSADDGLYETKGNMRLPKAYMEFDYIFSGRNLDVLSLDLQIENLNLLLMQGVKLGQGLLFANGDAATKKPEDGETVTKDPASALGLTKYDPIPLRMLSEQERTNFSNLASTAKSDSEDTPQKISQQYTQNLSDFYNMSGQAKMTIRGNPGFFGQVSLPFIPEHVSAVTASSATSNSGSSENVKSKWRTDLETRLNEQIKGTSMVSSPLFIKVNVYGPNVDFLTLDPIDSDENFAKQLFTDNFYWCGTIKTKIEGSSFTQDLELHKFGVFGAQNPNAAAKAAVGGAI